MKFIELTIASEYASDPDVPFLLNVSKIIKIEPIGPGGTTAIFYENGNTVDCVCVEERYGDVYNMILEPAKPMTEKNMHRFFRWNGM